MDLQFYAFALAPLGLLSFFTKELRKGTSMGIAPLVAMGAIAAAKGIGSWLKGRGADKKAKIEAENQGKMNAWKNKFDTANWDVEKKSYYTGRDRSRSMRKQLQAAMMNNPKYGLDKLFPGFAQYQTGVPTTANPYATAGPAPALAAATGGALANVGGGIADAAGTFGSMYAAKG